MQEPASFRTSNGQEAHRLDTDAASEASHDGSASQHSQQGSTEGQGPFKNIRGRTNRRGFREPSPGALPTDQLRSEPGAGPSAAAAGTQPGATQPAANESHAAGLALHPSLFSQGVLCGGSLTNGKAHVSHSWIRTEALPIRCAP